jgi:drug/metabolite transporter (DMT)-like permease
MPPGADERSLGELFAELSRETGVLVRKEVELATTELSGKLKVAGTQAGIVAAGGALAHAGLLILLAAIVIGLTQLGMPAWLAALLVALAVMAGGYALVNQGLSKMRSTSFTPVQTMETLKENATWTTRTRA